jgi:uncharacterized MAPEG superfamily protein
MIWVDIVTLLAAVQLVVFGVLVGVRAANMGSLHPPPPAIRSSSAITAQMNTVESLLVFFPGLWIAAKYWSPPYAAILGAVYLVGRFIYLTAYVKDPKKRSVGFALTMLPTLALVVAGLIGAIHALATS